MKKTLFILASASLILLSCAKEKEVDVTPSTNPSSIDVADSIFPYSITAIQGTEGDSKTTYDADGNAAWVLNDEVALFAVDAATPENQGWVAYRATTLANSNRLATFTKVDGQGEKESAMSSYIKKDIAIYPSSVAQPSTGNTGATVDGNIYITLPSDVSGLASENVLIGTANNAENPTFFDFKSAMAQMRVTVTDIPAEAASLRLYTNDQENYPLSGFFVLTDSKEITNVDYRKNGEEHSGRDYLAVDLTGEGALDTHDFFFCIPTGTYPSGTLTIKMLDGSDIVLLEKSLNKEREFVRNDLVRMSGLANQWTTLGTGKFMDKMAGSNNGLFADVVIQKSMTTSNQYRIVNPYGLMAAANSVTATSPDPYLVFTINTSLSPKRITYDEHYTGIQKGAQTITIKHPSVPRWKGQGVKTELIPENKVVTEDGDGNPLVVQFAPVYWYRDGSDGYANYTPVLNNSILVFPGYDTSFEVECSGQATATDLTFKVSGANVSTARIGVRQNRNDGISDATSTDAFNGATGKLVSNAKEDATGTYSRYICTRVYNSDGAEIAFSAPTTTTTLYSISSSDAGTVVSQYVRDLTIGNYTSNVGDVDVHGDNTLTIAVSNNPIKGNIMITEFAGLNYDKSQSTFSTYTSDGYAQSGWTNGSPIYGIYACGTVHDGKNGAKFVNVNEQTLYTDANQFNHNIGTGQSGQQDLLLAFNTKYYFNTDKKEGTETHDLAVWHPFIENCYGNSLTSYDFYFSGYTAFKTKGMVDISSSITAFSTKAGTSVANLVDKEGNHGGTDTGYWRSNYSGSNATNDQGIWLEINLGESKPSGTGYTLKFLTPNLSHGLPSKIRIAVSNDHTTWNWATDERTIDSPARNTWYQESMSYASQYQYIRLCVTQMNHTSNKDSPVDLIETTESGGRYVNLDELQLWENN